MEVLLLAGVPLREPIARHGPFVMNTESEIIEAIQDYRAGRMGRIAPSSRSTGAGAIGALGLALLAALSGSGCAGSSQTRNDIDQQEYSTTVTIVGSRAEAQLNRGREAIAAGRFAEGIAIFEDVSVMPKAKPEHREQALLALGQAHSNILNPARDPDRALGYYRQLLGEFPETKQRYEVERAIAELEESQHPD
jgi:tetratricopeptide (TPR) repeat protein